MINQYSQHRYEYVALHWDKQTVTEIMKALKITYGHVYVIANALRKAGIPLSKQAYKKPKTGLDYSKIKALYFKKNPSKGILPRVMQREAVTVPQDQHHFGRVRIPV